VQHAHALNLTAGWYGNNCICEEDYTNEQKFYEGDVKALRQYGFDSWKIDGCGAQLDMQRYSDLIDATSDDSHGAVLVENCHWGSVEPFTPNATWCPWHFYRTSMDVFASYESVLRNLQTVVPYATAGLSHPGCWAYPDMLEVGSMQASKLYHTRLARTVGSRRSDPGLSLVEQQTHFSAWAIASSPLVLSFDVTDSSAVDAVWHIIANREVLEVNQAWAGHSGSPFWSSNRTVDTSLTWNCCEGYAGTKGDTQISSFQYWYKPVEEDGARTAVLLMNNGDAEVDFTLTFADIPGVTCTSCHVRDILLGTDLGVFDGAFVAEAVASHAAPFLVITPAEAQDVGGVAQRRNHARALSAA